jgi:hypothetical protein
VIEHVETTRVICPADLRRPLPAAQEPAADAIVTHNEAGGAWIDGLVDRAQAAVAVITDSLAACAKAGAQ